MNPRKLISGVCVSLLLILGIQFLNPTAASAGCRDYPESVTPACEAQNMAEQQAMQIAQAAEQAARQAAATQIPSAVSTNAPAFDAPRPLQRLGSLPQVDVILPQQPAADVILDLLDLVLDLFQLLRQRGRGGGERMRVCEEGER